MINIRIPTMPKYKALHMPAITEYNVPKVFRHLVKYLPLSMQSMLFWIMLVIFTFFILCSCYSCCKNYKFRVINSGYHTTGVIRQRNQNRRPYVINIATKNARNEREIETFSLVDLDKLK